jgi:hypothetical protein
MHGEVLGRLHSRPRGIKQGTHGANCPDDAPVFDPNEDRTVGEPGLDPLVEENESFCPELFSESWERVSDWAVRQLYRFTTVAFILVPECFQQQSRSRTLGGALKPDDPTGHRTEGGTPHARPLSQLA